VDFIDFYTQAKPTPVAKAAPTPWDGIEGERARQRGVRTADEFAVLNVIEAECRASKSIGVHLSDSVIARRLRASPDGVERIIQALIMRGVVRADSGLFGERVLVPSAAK
jgi:hypothetical protein